MNLNGVFMLNHDDKNVDSQLDELVENHTDTSGSLPSLSSEETRDQQPSLLEKFQLGLKENTIEQLKIMTRMINQKMTDIRIAVYLIWYTKAYLSMKYSSFKSYVENELTITYNAATRQVAAAQYANKLFGYEKIGFFSDSSMLTIGRLPFRLQVMIIHKIAKNMNVTPKTLGKKHLTKQLIESIAEAYLDKANLKKLRTLFDTEKEDLDAGALDKSLEIAIEHQRLQSIDAIKDDNGKCVWDDSYDPFYDYLAEMTDLDALYAEIFANCSVRKLLDHIEMYKSEHYEYCQLLIQESPNRIFEHVYNLYESDFAQTDKKLECKNFEDDEVDFDDEIDQLEELEKNYPEPCSASEKQSYISERRKLVGQIQSIAEKTRVETHPKLVVINAVIAILEPDDLAYLLAKCSNILNQNALNFSSLDDDSLPGLDDEEVFSLDFDGTEG
jgi:hypothetical protein